MLSGVESHRLSLWGTVNKLIGNVAMLLVMGAMAAHVQRVKAILLYFEAQIP